jgi:hypothetical protein
MTRNIIIQCFLVVLASGGIAGIVKLPGKQKWIGAFVIILSIVGSLLTWLIH